MRVVAERVIWMVAWIVCGLACTAAPAASVTPAATPSATPLATTALPKSDGVEDLAAQFRYDANVPLAVRELSSSRAGSVAISEIEYSNARGGKATASLYVPDGTSRRPALLMSPGSNQPRSQISSEALNLAADLGAVVLAVDQSQIAMQRSRVWTWTAQDREEAIESVIDLLRGADLLAARSDVDTGRLALNGFSYGSWLSAIAAAVDRRISVLVLRSGGPQILSDIAGPSRSGDPSFRSYLQVMATVDQSRYAASLPATTAVLVQNGLADQTYPLDGMRAWQAAVSGMKTARLYDGAGHTLTAAADADRLTFLRDRWRM